MLNIWPFNTSIAARSDMLVRAYARPGRFSGAVLVARGDRVLYKRGYGLASHEFAKPNTTHTAFRIGSQTKAFTAIAVLQLQERGMLKIQDSIATYLPGYPEGERISIHHLLTNTSGIPDYIAAEEFSSQMALPHSLEQLIARFKDRPLQFDPGERFGYSNSGWVLLGAIVERVAGQAYGDYVEQQICEPAGMRGSGLARPGQVLDGHATGYTSLEGTIVRTVHIDNSTQFAAGDLHATAEDMYSWLRALDGDMLLGRESRDLMLLPHIETEHGAYGYGCVLRNAFGRRLFETSGGTIGFVSITTRYDDGTIVVVLSNLESCPFNEVERDLAAIALGQPYTLPSDRVFVSVDPAIFGAYLGRYKMSYVGRTHLMDVTRKGDRLMVEVQGLPKTALRPISPASYFAQMKGEVELTFVANNGEPTQEIGVNWAGHALIARRVVDINRTENQPTMNNE
jgi:CubicO group peptidase (beta-lactamase class C family)